MRMSLSDPFRSFAPDSAPPNSFESDFPATVRNSWILHDVRRYFRFTFPMLKLCLQRTGPLEVCGVLPNLTYTIPPPSLMRELREVVSDAGALAGELEKANRLPLDFPTEQLHELLAELQSLPAGTAEGCRQPLEYARARLPAVRRQFIQTEEEVRQPMADEDAPPSLTRGMTIDLRIGALVNSVTTALDEYRALASAHDDDAADTAPSIKIDATSPDAVHAMAVSQKAERAIGEHVNELQRITKPDSVTADNLKRQMHDARGLLSLRSHRITNASIRTALVSQNDRHSPRLPSNPERDGQRRTDGCRCDPPNG
jgi:hypothetical protein